MRNLHKALRRKPPPVLGLSAVRYYLAEVSLFSVWSPIGTVIHPSFQIQQSITPLVREGAALRTKLRSA
jgi:hypothetical protein